MNVRIIPIPCLFLFSLSFSQELHSAHSIISLYALSCYYLKLLKNVYSMLWEMKGDIWRQEINISFSILGFANHQNQKIHREVDLPFFSNFKWEQMYWDFWSHKLLYRYSPYKEALSKALGFSIPHINGLQSGIHVPLEVYEDTSRGNWASTVLKESNSRFQATNSLCWNCYMRKMS